MDLDHLIARLKTQAELHEEGVELRRQVEEELGIGRFRRDLFGVPDFLWGILVGVAIGFVLFA